MWKKVLLDEKNNVGAHFVESQYTSTYVHISKHDYLHVTISVVPDLNPVCSAERVGGSNLQMEPAACMYALCM